MPKISIDYSKCCIYKIEHLEDDNLLYVGLTTNFNKRKGKHKSICKNEKDKNYNLKLYQMIRGNGGWDMFRMIEIEKYPCQDKREAEKRETEIMKELKSNLNVKKSYISKEEEKQDRQEYYIKNKDNIIDKSHKYYENNKEKISEKSKVRYIDKKEQIIEQHKKYTERNREKIRASFRE
jgi:predicted GIY-YIG superfamily endonuclease